MQNVMQMQFGRGMFICSFNFQRKIYFNANIWDSIYEKLKGICKTHGKNA